MLTSLGLRQRRERKDLVDNDMHLRNVVGSSSHVDKAVDAIKQMLTSQRIGLRRERNDLVDMMGHAYGGPTVAGQVKPQSNYLGQPTHLNKIPTKFVEPFIKDISIEQSMWSEVSRRAIQTKCLQLDDIEKRRSKSIMLEIRETSDKTKKGEVKGNSQQLIPLSNPTPLNCDASECIKEAEGKTNQWVQDNILRLSQMFGMSFDSCYGEALTLLLKIDQRREKEGSLASSAREHNDNQIIPKELKNLIFNVKFKDGEPRSESRSGEGRGHPVIMNLKILSWNVRGLNMENKRNLVKSRIQQERGRYYSFDGD
ncbi:hypothetical protein KY289_033663 [Solanum tuberosum]|nr:hypothetical protein KY289_033663 [Solanum tuberosum]